MVGLWENNDGDDSDDSAGTKQYSLRVGDKIGYKPYLTGLHTKPTVEGIVD